MEHHSDPIDINLLGGDTGVSAREGLARHDCAKDFVWERIIPFP